MKPIDKLRTLRWFAMGFRLVPKWDQVFGPEWSLNKYDRLQYQDLQEKTTQLKILYDQIMSSALDLAAKTSDIDHKPECSGHWKSFGKSIRKYFIVVKSPF